MQILNRQLYFKTSGIQLFVIVRDVTSGVHSLPDLENFPLKSVFNIGEFKIHVLASCTIFSNKMIANQLSTCVESLL